MDLYFFSQNFKSNDVSQYWTEHILGNDNYFFTNLENAK